MYKVFCVSRGSCVKSHESASVGDEDNKFENEKDLGVWSLKDVISPDLCSPLLKPLLQARGSS